MPESYDLVLKIVISIVGTSVSLLMYFHYRLQRKDSWLRDFRELHKTFWNDDSMAEVRAWLANEESYQSVVTVLKTRRAIDENRESATAITPKEYEKLEKLDKFCNLMISVQVLDPHFEDHRSLWESLFVVYWVDQILSDNRAELRWYVERFYDELVSGWRKETRTERIRSWVRKRFRVNTKAQANSGPTARRSQDLHR